VSGALAAGPIADAAVEDLRLLERRLEADLIKILVGLDTLPGEDSLVRRQAQTTAAVLRQVQDRLEREGEVLRSVVGQRAVEAVTAVLGAPPSTLPVSVREELDLIVDGRTSDVVRVFREARDEIRDAVNAGVTTSGSLGDLIEQVRERLSTTYARAQAAIDAAVMAVGRHTVMSDARELEDELDLVYVYVGPRDDKNRPFCRAWVGNAVTDPSLLDNGQGLPVDDYCGGYNCRHSWAPTPLATAIAEGIKVYHPDGSPMVVEQGQTRRRRR
jgi:hypothetical protein